MIIRQKNKRTNDYKTKEQKNKRTEERKAFQPQTYELLFLCLKQKRQLTHLLTQ